MKEINEFATYLKNVRNLSDSTIYAYSSDLREFCAVMGFSDVVNEITLHDVETVYIANLVASGNCAASRSRKLSSVRVFYKWAVKNGIVKNNPVAEIEMPKIEKKSVNAMSCKEVEQVLNEAKNDYGDEAFRNLAIVSLMFYSGLRRAEITEIKLNDLNLEECSLVVHGKGSKDRIAYFNNTTRTILYEYVNVHRKFAKPAQTSEYLFVSQRDEKLCLSTVNRVVNRYLNAAGIKQKGYTAHSPRKAFATAVYENTGDIFAVQQLLGHSSPATTQRYVGVAEYRKREAAMTVNF